MLRLCMLCSLAHVSYVWQTKNHLITVLWRTFYLFGDVCSPWFWMLNFNVCPCDWSRSASLKKRRFVGQPVSEVFRKYWKHFLTPQRLLIGWYAEYSSLSVLLVPSVALWVHMSPWSALLGCDVRLIVQMAQTLIHAFPCYSGLV